MRKLIALLAVVGWSGFWAFGYLALSAGIAEERQAVTAALLAAAGLFSGSLAWLWLCREGHRRDGTPPGEPPAP